MYKKYTYYVYRYTDLPHNSANVGHQIVGIDQQIYSLEWWLVRFFIVAIVKTKVFWEWTVHSDGNWRIFAWVLITNGA